MDQPDVSTVSIERSGGQVPTYRPSFKVDVKNLSEQERKTLLRLLQEIDLKQQAARSPGRAVPDAFTYTLNVENASGTQKVVFSDQDGHPKSLDALLNWIKEHTPK